MANLITLGVTLLCYTISFALALAAISKRSQATSTLDTKTNNYQCEYTSDIATGLAVGSFIFLLLAHTFIMFATRWLCCGRKMIPGSAKTFGIFAFLLSWFCFIVAASALIAGAAQNKIQTQGYYKLIGNKVTCREVQKSVFEAGAAFIFLSMLLSELYYILISRARAPEPWQSTTPSVGMSPYP